MKKILFLAIVVLGINVLSFGQSTANANISATVIQPLTITKNIDMDFGNLAAGIANGTVVLTPSGSRSSTGGVILTSITGMPSAAQFDLTGAAGYTFSIVLPTTANVKFGNNTMTVTNFTSTPTPTGTLGVNGKQTLLVGATLNVNANQAAGVYHQDTQFAVTVNYN